MTDDHKAEAREALRVAIYRAEHTGFTAGQGSIAYGTLSPLIDAARELLSRPPIPAPRDVEQAIKRLESRGFGERMDYFIGKQDGDALRLIFDAARRSPVPADTPSEDGYPEPHPAFPEGFASSHMRAILVDAYDRGVTSRPTPPEDVAAAIAYLTPIAESATVGRYGEMLRVALAALAAVPACTPSEGDFPCCDDGEHVPAEIAGDLFTVTLNRAQWHRVDEALIAHGRNDAIRGQIATTKHPTPPELEREGDAASRVATSPEDAAAVVDALRKHAQSWTVKTGQWNHERGDLLNRAADLLTAREGLASREVLTEDITRFLLAVFGQPVAWTADELGTEHEEVAVVGHARKIAEALTTRFAALAAVPADGETEWTTEPDATHLRDLRADSRVRSSLDLIREANSVRDLDGTGIVGRLADMLAGWLPIPEGSVD